MFDFFVSFALCKQEVRRQQQAEAAERRRQQGEARGVKDPEALKKKQKRQEEAEKQSQTSPQGGGLKVCCHIIVRYHLKETSGGLLHTRCRLKCLFLCVYCDNLTQPYFRHLV